MCLSTIGFLDINPTKEMVNVVGGYSLGGHHPFKKEKKKKNKKVQNDGSQTEKS